MYKLAWFFNLALVWGATGAGLVSGFARYGQNITTDKGNCNFPHDSYKRFVAVGPKVFESSVACGLCMQIKTRKGVLTAGVVDTCVGCSPTDIVLDVVSFGKIGNTTLGVIPIQWQPVLCRASGGIRFQWVKGSTASWSAVTIRNAAAPVKLLEVFFDQKWVPVKHEYYNYFTLASFGPGPFKFRMTSYFNEILTEDSVPMMNITSFKSKAQFSKS